MLATQVMARMRKVFERELSLQWLFEHPTIKGMGGVIERVFQGAGESSIPPLVNEAGVEQSSCRMRRSGCGLWSNWSIAAARTTYLWRCG